MVSAMSTFTVATVILCVIGVLAALPTASERRRQERQGISWIEALARRSPSALLPQGDRDLARTLDDVRAVSQRETS